MDTLDPLTEIIKSGQAFSPAIAIERTLWIFMGFFFLGAIIKSMIGAIKQNYSSENKSISSSLNASKRKGNLSNKFSVNK